MALLTTLEAARRQLFGNDPEISADDILNALIASSSAWVEREVGGDLMQATITETIDGDGGTKVRLARSHSWRPGRPTTTVTSVKVDGETIPERPAVSVSYATPSGWVYRNDCVELVGYTFSPGTANVVVVYQAGFATCPTDIEQACLEHIAARYKRRGNEGQASSAGGGDSVSYGDSVDFAFIKGSLEQYRPLGFA